MRKSKVVQFDDRDFEATVKEVTVKQVIEATQDEGGPSVGLSNLVKDAVGLDPEQLMDLYGSELEKVWAAFVELNSFFFKSAKQFGLDSYVTEMITNFLIVCGKESASSVMQDTEIQ